MKSENNKLNMSLNELKSENNNLNACLNEFITEMKSRNNKLKTSLNEIKSEIKSAIRARTVSYTHLDVYKRQLMYKSGFSY